MSDSDYVDYPPYNILKKIVLKDGLRAFKFFKKIIDNTSQGSVGILKCVVSDESLYLDDVSDEISAREFMTVLTVNNNQKYIIYKIGTETPYLCRHEYAVSVSLYKLSPFLPNFMKPYDLIKNARADPRQKNPFVTFIEDKSDKTRTKQIRPKTFADMALFEYINSNMTLSDLISINVKGKRALNEDIQKIKASDFKIINSLLNQLMIAILIAQQKLSFIHNDLHFDNVLVCKCLKRTFMLYVFEYNSICYALLPTHGYYPIVIDYGFSFSEDLIGGPLLTGIHHNDKGYMNHQYDEFTDFKTMLTRLSYSGYQFGLKKKDVFQNLMFDKLISKLPIDKQTGWDETKDISVSKQLVRHIRIFVDDYLKSINCESFFQKYDYEMVDMIGSLIILPLREKNTENLVETLATFFKEWLKIEKWIGSSHMKIFVFKNIIDKIRSDVLNNTPIENFQKTIYKIMNEVGNNIILTGLDYELFYKSILKLSDCFEGIMYKANQKCLSRKTKEYSKMEMKSSLEMYQLIEPFISNDYQLECGDYFVVCNAINETTSSFVLKDLATVNTVNSMNRCDRAEYLFKCMV